MFGLLSHFTARPSRAALLRRSQSIAAYNGSNGGGKSLAMVYDCLPDLDRGVRVLSTVGLLDRWSAVPDNKLPKHLTRLAPGHTPIHRRMIPSDPGPDADELTRARYDRRLADLHDRTRPRTQSTGDPDLDAALGAIEPITSDMLPEPDPEDPHPTTTALTKLVQLLDFSDGVLALDEVTGVVSARSYASAPPQLINMLVQMRRRNIRVAWSSPSYSRADVVLREVTQAVTQCRGFFPQRSTDPETGEPLMWGARRLFFWTTYDAKDFDDLDSGKLDKARPLARQLYLREIDRNRAQHAYRTLDGVHMLDTVADGMSGTYCLICGGSKPRAKCQGHEGHVA